MRHRERKSMRLPEYDYSMPGAYFVTACTRNREVLFDTPESKLAVESAWHSLLDIFANLELDEFVVMPNHVHLHSLYHPRGFLSSSSRHMEK